MNMREKWTMHCVHKSKVAIFIMSHSWVSHTAFGIEGESNNMLPDLPEKLSRSCALSLALALFLSLSPPVTHTQLVSFSIVTNVPDKRNSWKDLSGPMEGIQFDQGGRGMASNARSSRPDVPASRKEGETTAGAQLPFSFVFNLEPMEWRHPVKSGSWRLYKTKLETPRYAQRFPSVTILTPISLPIKSNHHTSTERSQCRCSSSGQAKGPSSVQILGHTHRG